MAAHAQHEWAEHALTRFGDAGYRRGGARTAVVELLDGEDCALSAVEIEDRLRAEGRRVARASVYRVLEQLVELRLVQRLDVGRGMARYERVLPSGDHHHHMVCDSCGTVVPFEDRDLERSIERLSERTSFEVAEHDVVLRGACADCRD